MDEDFFLPSDLLSVSPTGGDAEKKLLGALPSQNQRKRPSAQLAPASRPHDRSYKSAQVHGIRSQFDRNASQFEIGTGTQTGISISSSTRPILDARSRNHVPLGSRRIHNSTFGTDMEDSGLLGSILASAGILDEVVEDGADEGVPGASDLRADASSWQPDVPDMSGLRISTSSPNSLFSDSDHSLASLRPHHHPPGFSNEASRGNSEWSERGIHATKSTILVRLHFRLLAPLSPSLAKNAHVTKPALKSRGAGKLSCSGRKKWKRRGSVY